MTMSGFPNVSRRIYSDFRTYHESARPTAAASLLIGWRCRRLRRLAGSAALSADMLELAFRCSREGVVVCRWTPPLHWPSRRQSQAGEPDQPLLFALTVARAPHRFSYTKPTKIPVREAETCSRVQSLRAAMRYRVALQLLPLPRSPQHPHARPTP
jgi:hypothetical protein